MDIALPPGKWGRLSCTALSFIYRTALSSGIKGPDVSLLAPSRCIFAGGAESLESEVGKIHLLHKDNLQLAGH